MVLKMDLSFKLILWDLERRKLNHVVESFFNFSLHYLYPVRWALFLEMLRAEAAFAEVFVIAGGLSCLPQPLFLWRTPLRCQRFEIVLKLVLGGERPFLVLLRPGRSKSSPGGYLLLCFIALKS